MRQDNSDSGKNGGCSSPTSDDSGNYIIWIILYASYT